MTVKTIVLVEAEDMKKEKTSSDLLDILLDFDTFRFDDKINFETNILLEHPHPLVKVFNNYLRLLNSQGTVRIIISL